MLEKRRFKRYEYPIKEGKQTYLGSYTIYEEVEPSNYPGERLVQTFSAVVFVPDNK